MPGRVDVVRDNAHVPFALLRVMRRVTVLAALAAVTVVAVTAGRVWWTARQDQRPASDAIVVLGASQFDGRPSAVFRNRLVHAAALQRQAVAPRIVTLGGARPGDRFSEAQAGANWLHAYGVPRSRLLAVPAGTDTLSSLRAADAVFARHGWRSAVLVTDPWHSLRSRAIATDLGWRVATSPTRSGPVVQTRGTEARYVVRETFGYLYYRIFRRSSSAQAAAGAAHVV
jgi:uncharacterized SAM-binding protein YcdF (DUF218 family)